MLIARDREIRCSQKRDLGACSGHLSFWISGVELPLIFLYKKKKQEKKLNTTLHD